MRNNLFCVLLQKKFLLEKFGGFWNNTYLCGAKSPTIRTSATSDGRNCPRWFKGLSLIYPEKERMYNSINDDNEKISNNGHSRHDGCGRYAG